MLFNLTPPSQPRHLLLFFFLLSHPTQFSISDFICKSPRTNLNNSQTNRQCKYTPRLALYRAYDGSHGILLAGLSQ
ncbi:hypothetical protein BDV36DRAFT_124015 [Aspergillus pseudocaelatus]|uniref:Secreted protein n=1 Tax=Aspergillus pseudocaelatus TaxID=1825620 RepID=A0ABQ6VZQ3_9EURO|nr:hypothetical protein BDV36DRAFT_124015 [Aspergillus pseudocaelatus]